MGASRLMWNPADIEDAILNHPHEAADALAAIQLDSSAPRIDPAALKVAAELIHVPVERLWVQALDAADLLASFARAMEARGAPINKNPIALHGTNIPHDQLAQFISSASSFGCRIEKDGQIVGSGILVGPTTVLTAWHVIARAAPDSPQKPWPKIEVLLSDQRRLKAQLPAAYESMCGADEYANVFPKNDTAVQGLHDVAVLKLATPAGALLGTAKLPDAPAPYQANNTILLVHYPAGTNVGIGVGSMARIRRLNARWAHTVGTRGGSSGGGCFDSSLTLVGIHQGRDPRDRGRMVPAQQFYDQLRAIIANDEAPTRMWSLDGTPQGEFIIGRQGFFDAFAMVRNNPRVRGIRIKRANAAGDLSGLPFSYHLTDRMTSRSPEMRLIRLSFEAVVPDVADEIARRATDAGIAVDPVGPKAGVAEDQSAPEAVGADRGRRVAAAIDRKAAELGLQAWVFIDHPAIVFSDGPRSALEAFIDASIQHENIRLVIAGFEAVALPGQDFYEAPDPVGEGGRGLMVEFLDGFRPSDVRLFVIDAASAAGKSPSNERIDEIVNDALDGLPNDNQVYAPWVGADVTERLKVPVAKLFGGSP